MFNRLQQKWNVSGWRLLLILITFAVGGSLTGLAGRRVLIFLGVEDPWLYVPIYIIYCHNTVAIDGVAGKFAARAVWFFYEVPGEYENENIQQRKPHPARLQKREGRFEHRTRNKELRTVN